MLLLSALKLARGVGDVNNPARCLITSSAGAENKRPSLSCLPSLMPSRAYLVGGAALQLFISVNGTNGVC